MTEPEENAETVGALLATPHLADALESEPFRRFLDQVPIAIVVAELKDPEQIVYSNPEFEKLSGLSAAEVAGQPWSVLPGRGESADAAQEVGAFIVNSNDFAGTFRIERDEAEPAIVDVYSNVIEDEDGTPAYRLAALVDVGQRDQAQREEFEQRIREKDILLWEIQHRVKNNLQMIAAVMRIEARNAQGRMDTAPFDRLAGRVEAIQLLYKSLAQHEKTDEVDLGVYLSEITSSVMHAHAVEGIRLDLKVDSYPVSVNVAMPTGLVVNELLTNALKHAFVGRERGTITLHSLSDGTGCRVIIADDGIGLPEGVEWPQRGKLSSMIVQSLRDNAKAQLEVQSRRGHGMRVTIIFSRASSAPTATD
jgi:PAS domain S-box-containing protein